MKHNYDLAVIGAGIIGTFTAWMARKEHPNWKIALIDRSLVGHGASTYSATMDFPYGHTPMRKTLSKRSREWYDQMLIEIPDLPFKELPFYGFIQKSNAKRLVGDFIDERSRIADEHEMQHVVDRYKGLHLPNNSVMICDTRVYYDSDNQLVSLLANTFMKSNLSDCWEGTEILNISKDNGIYLLNNDRHEQIRAKRVIQATGPWLPFGPFSEYARESGIKTKKIVACHILHPPEKDDPIFYFFDHEAFLLPQYHKSRWLFSFRCSEWDVYPEVSKLKISSRNQEEAMAVLTKYYSSFVNFCHGGRVFCDSYGKDDNPLIQEVPSFENYIIAGAGSGSGYRLAPAIAEKALGLLK